jgi:type IV pilus assembly protein PilA
MKIGKQQGFTLIELLIVVAIIGIIAAIAAPGLLRARMSSNEASAIGSLRAINTAQQNYSQLCRGYAPVLTELGTTGAGAFLSPDLSLGVPPIAKSGYRIDLVTGLGAAPIPIPTIGCTAPTTNYYATAVPLTAGSTGARGFATNETYAVYQNNAAAATAPTQPFTIGGNISTIQ